MDREIGILTQLTEDKWRASREKLDTTYVALVGRKSPDVAWHFRLAPENSFHAIRSRIAIYSNDPKFIAQLINKSKINRFAAQESDRGSSRDTSDRASVSLLGFEL